MHPEATHGRTVTRTDCGHTVWMISGQVSRTVTVTWQKIMEEINGRFRCTLPGICPGQAEKVLELRKQGAEAIIIGTCED